MFIEQGRLMDFKGKNLDQIEIQPHGMSNTLCMYCMFKQESSPIHDFLILTFFFAEQKKKNHQVHTVHTYIQPQIRKIWEIV